MTPLIIQRHLAAALGDAPEPWPESWSTQRAQAAVVEEILYHGVAGLLIDKPAALKGWPDGVIAPVRQQAIGQAMWELHHRSVLGDLISAFGQEGIVPLFLKGTATAYDLYESPAKRSRGDTDLLVSKRDVARARTILNGLGYRTARYGAAGAMALQQTWTLNRDDGTRHLIDLHAQVMNAPALQDVLPFEECLEHSMSLPRLLPEARGLDHGRALIHTCMHRSISATSPYLVDGKTYFGAERLIWVYDIHLLAGAHSSEDWRRLCDLCEKHGAAAVCLDGLQKAGQLLGTEIPHDVRAELSQARRKEKASHYLLRSSRLSRARQDVLATRGFRRKLKYLRNQLLPSGKFLRAKYQGSAGTPVGQLYMRRIVELLRPRPQRDAER